jgi:general secretion pathway protein N
MRPDGKLRGWGLVCLLLAAAIAAEWQAFAGGAPDAGGAIAPSDAAAPAEQGHGAAALGPLTAYAAVTERPLFTRSRRPPAADTSTAPADLERNFSVAGIMLSGQERIALVQQGSDKKLRSVREGETLGGWTVRSIASDRIVLVGRDGETALPLREKQARRAAR